MLSENCQKNNSITNSDIKTPTLETNFELNPIELTEDAFDDKIGYASRMATLLISSKFKKITCGQHVSRKYQ